MFSKLKQFKDLRDKAKTLQTALASEAVEGSAAWGKVKIGMDGNQSVTSVSIGDEMLQPGGKDKLETAIKEALNDALKKAQRKMIDKMKESGDFKMPGLSS
ncbi:MAG: YbaB/EbfC family nucleoid-associated protein [Patescibacteria group bacterium]|jgi:DNA-binding YbaB/EbfC family protein